MEEKAYLYSLMCSGFLGAVTIRKIYEYFQSFSGIFNIEEKELGQAGILKPRQVELFLKWKTRCPACLEEYQRLPSMGISLVSMVEEAYPRRLLSIYDYPAALFVKGSLPESGPMVAVVGARGCSAYGEQLAEEFARVLASEGVGIVSGLALGIDGAAHKGALKAGGRTYGVLGCGANICYPSANYQMYQEMTERGGVLSEFVPDTQPIARNFPMRNRIISGLADAVLVVEAREKSGSLITAELGLEQGREVFAVPGRVTDHLSQGCNFLIQQGAHMAVSPGDILEYLGVRYQKKLPVCEKNINRLAKKEKMVYSCLDFTPRHLDEIVRESGLSVSECMAVLLDLELGGYGYRTASHYYGKRI